MPVHVATGGVPSRFRGLWIPNQVGDDRWAVGVTTGELDYDCLVFEG
ncbi:hypothetical protein [Zhongshania aliphaticivorans]|nr:hypothetical protein [Zhongshania aliphaticivorans]